LNDSALSKVIVALDVASIREAEQILNSLAGRVEFVKIGMQAFFGYGERIIPYAKDRGFKVFLDLKLCDIPNTVSSAIKSLSRHKFDLLTVHISGGLEMLRSANIAIKDILPEAGIIGVTILTSLGEEEISSIGYQTPMYETIEKMIRLACEANITGVVCSAREIERVRDISKGGLKIITPGIRLDTDSAQDQKRVETPRVAFLRGADYVVMGRSIINGDIQANLDRVELHLSSKE